MTLHTLDTPYVRLTLRTKDNSYALYDKRAGVTWSGGGDCPWVRLVDDDVLDRFGGNGLYLQKVTYRDEALVCEFTDDAQRPVPLTLTMRLVEDALQCFVAAKRIRNDARVDNASYAHHVGVALPTIELFGDGLATGDDVLLPIRMGLLIRASEGEPFNRVWNTYDYEDLHMAMAAMTRDGAALMATWGDPYVRVGVTRDDNVDNPSLHMRLLLDKTARSIQLRLLGKADLAEIAAAYREQAEALGYRQTMAQKVARNPRAARLAGASDVKLWHALARKVDEDLNEVSVTVDYTFDEAARIAEHLKNDLGMDDVLFHLGGWTRHGYDCRHPDNWPPNPECGGEEGLADCAQRVQDCGYLFCLHDNFQDIYRDSPSWDERLLQREADGSPHMGGVWLGGQAYYTCSREALELARRPENLPIVAQRIGPDIHFIDTTFAVGLQECYDPRHPLTKQEDMQFKIALSDYARDTIGMFASECGREWAVAHADFFEGLCSVNGDYYHRLDPAALGAHAVPFFDMVFGDCIVIYGKYGTKPALMGEQVIHHVAMGRTLYYHGMSDYFKWEEADEHDELPLQESGPDAAVYSRAHNGWAEGLCLWDRYMKNTHELLSPLHALTCDVLLDDYQFLDDARTIRRSTFGDGLVTTTVNGSDEAFTVTSEQWGEVVLPPLGVLIESDTYVAFHALSFNGMDYAEPVLFTLRALDGAPLTESKQVRVFHAFGDAHLAWRDGVLEIKREAVL